MTMQDLLIVLAALVVPPMAGAVLNIAWYGMKKALNR